MRGMNACMRRTRRGDGERTDGEGDARIVLFCSCLVVWVSAAEPEVGGLGPCRGIPADGSEYQRLRRNTQEILKRMVLDSANGQ